jgi:hypothetical protein
MKLAYNAFIAGNINKPGFVAYMFIDDKSVAGVYQEGGSSSWVQWGVHKIQLSNAQMYGFDFCIDVFGDVSVSVDTGNPDCEYNYDIHRPECTAQWEDDNWGM